MIASDVLDLESVRDPSFGGESYPVNIGARTANVDWNVRDAAGRFG